MTIRFNTYDYDALFGAFTTFFIIMAGFAILVWTIFYFIKKSDKNKPVFATRAKILEKITDTLFVGWYLVEFENGERLKLRTFEPRKVFFSAGDIGILRYQGITILSFQKENNTYVTSRQPTKRRGWRSAMAHNAACCRKAFYPYIIFKSLRRMPVGRMRNKKPKISLEKPTIL